MRRSLLVGRKMVLGGWGRRPASMAFAFVFAFITPFGYTYSAMSNFLAPINASFMLFLALNGSIIPIDSKVLILFAVSIYIRLTTSINISTFVSNIRFFSYKTSFNCCFVAFGGSSNSSSIGGIFLAAFCNFLISSTNWVFLFVKFDTNSSWSENGSYFLD